MNIGYMMREDHEVKTDKLKKHYLKIGVKNTDKNSLSIPKHLKKVADRILKTFGAIMYNFYGVDPEEEARKQYFIDNGVQKVKANYSNKLLVPNKFKDNSEEITEMKNLFETYKIEFID
jgi:lipid II:glycine glycyltransferase (peptidoglycan interpeptide bridge formation enzyme)